MDVQVRRRDADYELTVDGQHAGRLVLREQDGAVVLEHTYVDDAFSGRGLAGILAQRVLDDLIAQGVPVVVECEYVLGWLDKHPEYDGSVQRADRGDRQA